MNFALSTNAIHRSMHGQTYLLLIQVGEWTNLSLTNSDVGEWTNLSLTNSDVGERTNLSLLIQT